MLFSLRVLGVLAHGIAYLYRVYQSEIFPLRAKAKGTGLATLSNWLNNTLIAFCYPFISKACGPKQYIIFGCSCLIMAVWSRTLPETKGKTLEEMDAIFIARAQKKLPPQDQYA